MDVRIMRITPETAAAWLLRNENNRSINASTVEKYARDMLSGSWSIGDSAIVISKDGNLLNGQHRLAACVKSGVTIYAIVRFGAEQEEVLAMDRGKSRNVVDNLILSGLTKRGSTYANSLSFAVARMYIDDENGKLGKNTKTYSDTELIESLRKHYGGVSVGKHLATMISARSANIKPVRNASFAFAIAKAYENGVNERLLGSFVDAIVFGCRTDRYYDLITDNRLSVASAYRSAYERLHRDVTRYRKELVGTVENAIYHYVNDDRVRLLKPSYMYPVKRTSGANGIQMSMEVE